MTKTKTPKATSAKIAQVRPQTITRASIIITNQYGPNIQEGIEQCQKMRESFARHGHEVANISDHHGKVKGNGNVLRELLACFKRASTGHTHFAYSDGADTFCQKEVHVPTDYLLYSAEKNCYPRKELAPEFAQEGAGPFLYLNGGGYGGPLKLAIEFFEKYGLDKAPGDCNGQHEQMVAYLKAKKDGFPIMLDTACEVFQTTAFTNENELAIKDGLVHNLVTGTVPAILHGNGISPMKWIYEGVNNG